MIYKFGRRELGMYFYNPLSTESNIFVKTDGSSTIISDFDFNSNKIINLAEPTNSHDAATKKLRRHSRDRRDWNGSGSCRFGLKFSHAINLNEPTSLHDAATKNYVDVSTSLCVKTNGSSTITGDMDLNSHKLINVSDPTGLHDAATKAYVDTKVAYSNIFYTDINMTSHKLTNLAELTLPSGSATKNYVDTHSSGGTISSITSDLNLNFHKMINVVDPTDAATKNYVDSSTSQCVKTD